MKIIEITPTNETWIALKNINIDNIKLIDYISNNIEVLGKPNTNQAFKMIAEFKKLLILSKQDLFNLSQLPDQNDPDIILLIKQYNISISELLNIIKIYKIK